MKATEKLRNSGQSLWLDNITRDLLTSGTLKRYIDTLLMLQCSHWLEPIAGSHWAEAVRFVADPRQWSPHVAPRREATLIPLGYELDRQELQTERQHCRLVRCRVLGSAYNALMPTIESSVLRVLQNR